MAIDAVEYERERDDCPMFFDDGENPWRYTDASQIIFDWDIGKASASRLRDISLSPWKVAFFLSLLLPFCHSSCIIIL